ncbi:YTH domain-containing protein 1 [Microdochium nivale]|nr:YTH domain-containing protein 1 [Microdochium nivale]
MESLPTADDTDPVTTVRHLVRDPAAAQDVYRWLVGSGWFDKSQHGRTFHAHQALDRQQAALNAARAELHRLGDSSDLVNKHSDNNHITTYDTVQSQEYAQQQPHFSQAPHSPGASTEILSEIEVAQRENIAPKRYATRDLFDNYGQDRDYSQRSANSHRSCDSRVAGLSHDPGSHASSHRDEARSHKRDAHRTNHGRNSRSKTQQTSSRRDDHRTSKFDRYRRESQSSANDHHGTARRRESQLHRRHSSRSKSPTPRRHSYHSLRDTPRRSTHRERSEYPDESRRRQSQSSRISRRETSFTFDPAPPAPSEPVLSVQEFASQDESAYEAHSLEAHGDAVQNTTAQRPFVSNQPQDRSPEKERDNLITPKAFNAGQPGETRFFILRSYNYTNIYQAQASGVWATQKINEDVFADAFRVCNNVVIFFGVNSGPFYGFARMRSLPSPSIPPPSWYRNLKMEATDPFELEWLSTAPCERHHVGHLRNELNGDLPVTRSRDGQEVSEAAGLEMVRIMAREARKMINGGIFGGAGEGLGTQTVS